MFKKLLIFILSIGAIMANELKFQDSPYLKQHADNPVNWFAWSEKAFEKAKKENKLIFLSIGYSTCHWCHVMEKESFEDDGVARILNANFISIKVDREEMPDVDKYFQDVHHLLQRRAGGWPLTIVLLPNQKPIFAATYIPKENRGQMMGLKNILLFLQQKHLQEPRRMQESAKSIEEAMDSMQNQNKTLVQINDKIIDKFIQNIDQSYDPLHKGIGDRPKFPHASSFDVLLEIYNATKHQTALFLSEDALDAMSKGGIYDQIEGGFYRYSVDEMWQIPHFEKMLYTNAELISAYSKLYAITKEKRYKEVVKQTVDAMNERFQKEDLYLSASDADSEGEEGKYFVFEYKKSKEKLLHVGFTKDETDEMLKYLNITPKGNFEHGLSNPFISSEKAPTKLQQAKLALKELRLHVNYPFIDDKILTSWNSLFITSLFDAGKNIDERYTKMAFKTLDKLLSSLYKNESLYHQLVWGSKLKLKALLEDYAFLSESLLKAYEISEDKKYLILAKTFIQKALRDFYKDSHWYLGYFPTHAELSDNAYKSAMAVMINNMLLLSLFKNDTKLYKKASKMLDDNSYTLSQYPHAYPTALLAYLQKSKKAILLKAPKGKLEKAREKVKSINYPFLHVISYEDTKFQACEIELCFAREESLDKIIDIIKERLE